jgi:hypothetical protein
MSQLYRQTCINGHPATVSPDDGKPWRCGDPECEYFDGADDSAYGLDSDPPAQKREPIQWVSACHSARCELVSGDEGTNFYICAECGKPCDPVGASSSGVKAKPEQRNKCHACGRIYYGAAIDSHTAEYHTTKDRGDESE